MKRIFIALKVTAGESLIEMVSSLRSGLINEGIRWVNLDNIHITLAFLGDTEEKMIKVIISKMKNYCEGSGNFELTLKGCGVFKNLGDPRIIWTGIEPLENLSRLNGLIVKCLIESGVKIDERGFKPHLTLGRIKFIKDRLALKALLDKYRDAKIQNAPVNEVILYESILKPTGPLYKPMAKIIL
jgi:RNA 2',3'-cyclic 3'-phosphodiesterase